MSRYLLHGGLRLFLAASVGICHRCAIRSKEICSVGASLPSLCRLSRQLCPSQAVTAGVGIVGGGPASEAVARTRPEGLKSLIGPDRDDNDDDHDDVWDGRSEKSASDEEDEEASGCVRNG